MLLFEAGIWAYFTVGLESENEETDQRKKQLINGCKGRGSCTWFVLKGHRSSKYTLSNILLFNCDTLLFHEYREIKTVHFLCNLTNIT